MRQKVGTIVIIVMVLFIGYEMLTDAREILDSVKFSLQIWLENIFPSLFPFFVLSEILIKLGFVEFMGEIFNPLMKLLFKARGEAGFVLAMSMLSGFPSGAKYTKELYDAKIINEHEATKLLTFTHLSSPMFIYGTIAVSFLNNAEVGLLILIIHVITNFIIGYIFKNYYISNNNQHPFSLKKAFIKMHHKRINNQEDFGQIITSALLNTINTLLLILGVISIFLIITTIINNNIAVNIYTKSILNGIFEVTQGLKYISILDFPLKIKTILSTMFISFGGLSVHMQVISIISETKIKYLPFLVARVMHTAIAGILVCLLFDIWLNIYL